jgi:3-phenylpropionate/trans-cinnamate dioxygenase ferredoxin reductase component
MSVNVWDVTDPIEAVICTRPPVDSERLAEPAVPLAELPERSRA